jgi:hypothetical protein
MRKKDGQNSGFRPIHSTKGCKLLGSGSYGKDPENP